MPHRPIAPPPARVLVHSSALIAIVDPDDPNHERANRAWAQLLDAITSGATSASTIQHLRDAEDEVRGRLGPEAAQAVADLNRHLGLYWVTESVDLEAGPAWLTSTSDGLDSHDRIVTRIIVERGGVDAAFAFDPELAAGGTTIWP